MSRPQAGADIHAVLDYAISQALLSGKVGKQNISVPLSDLMNAGEGLRITEDGEGIVLKVEIKTSFDIGTESLESEFEEDPVDEPF